jgi:hypothetical protein
MRQCANAGESVDNVFRGRRSQVSLSPDQLLTVYDRQRRLSPEEFAGVLPRRFRVEALQSSIGQVASAAKLPPKMNLVSPSITGAGARCQ